MVEQSVEIAGALLVLAAYALAQFTGLDRRSLPYLLPNLVGAAVLALVVLGDRHWGFLLLEGAWAVVTLAAIGARLTGRGPGGGR